MHVGIYATGQEELPGSVKLQVPIKHSSYLDDGAIGDPNGSRTNRASSSHDFRVANDGVQLGHIALSQGT